MHLLLTDRLSCPRCGPSFGLILLADDLVERRVREGTLGCPNCRDAYPVRTGFADLRAPPRGALRAGSAGADPSDDAAEAARLAALLGVARGPGTLALLGAPAAHADRLAEAVPDVHVVAVDADARTWPEHPDVSRLVAEPGLPFFDRVLRGVVVDGRLGRPMLLEASRVVAPGSRVVVLSAGGETPDTLREGGLTVLAQEAETVVAARG